MFLNVSTRRWILVHLEFLVMDLSPAPSHSKCSSDFSIERILSDDSKRTEEVTPAPSWLCCTRYQPPRLQRAGSACRSRRSGRHARVPFTAAQAAALETAYSRAPYLAPPALRALASALQLRDDRIKIWFQNRRARERREKSVTIPPPHCVTLLQTTANQKQSTLNSSWIVSQSSQSENDVRVLPFSQESSFHHRYSNTSTEEFVGNENRSGSEDNSNDSKYESPLNVET